MTWILLISYMISATFFPCNLVILNYLLFKWTVINSSVHFLTLSQNSSQYLFVKTQLRYYLHGEVHANIHPSHTQRPLLLLPPIPPSIRVFSKESTRPMRWPKYWSLSFSIIPYKERKEWGGEDGLN